MESALMDEIRANGKAVTNGKTKEELIKALELEDTDIECLNCKEEFDKECGITIKEYDKEYNFCGFDCLSEFCEIVVQNSELLDTLKEPMDDMETAIAVFEKVEKL